MLFSAAEFLPRRHFFALFLRIFYTSFSLLKPIALPSNSVYLSIALLLCRPKTQIISLLTSFEKGVSIKLYRFLSRSFAFGNYAKTVAMQFTEIYNLKLFAIRFTAFCKEVYFFCPPCGELLADCFLGYGRPWLMAVRLRKGKC